MPAGDLSVIASIDFVESPDGTKCSFGEGRLIDQL